MSYLCPVISKINNENKMKEFFLIFFVVYSVFYLLYFKIFNSQFHTKFVNENSLIYYNKYYNNHNFGSFFIDLIIYSFYAFVSFTLYKKLSLKFIASANFLITNIISIVIVDILIGMIMKLNINNEIFQLWKGYVNHAGLSEIMLDIVIFNILAFITIFVMKFVMKKKIF